MRDQFIIQLIRHAFVGCGTRLHDIIKGASGLSAYEQYLGHLHARHPDALPMSREEFFRADVEARWDGVRRCC